MAQLTVRHVDDRIVQALAQQAAAHGRSAEAEHRDILRQVLLDDTRDDTKARKSFAERAVRLRRRLQSDVDSAGHIRSDRDRDAPV